MSKVIRAAQWQTDSYVIEPPPPPPKPEPEEDENAGPVFDEEAQTHMLAEIAEKQQKAEQMLKDAEAAADAMKQDAQNEHDRLLEEAKKECEDLRAQARQEGHEEGLAEGRKDGEAAVREEMKQMLLEGNEKAMKTLQDAREAADDYMSRAEQDIAKIVMRVVEKILPQHFLDVPQVVIPVVQQAILKVRDQKEINVHVPPDSYDMILMARDELRTILTDGTAVLEITSDESLSPGDCVIETPNGGVDARLMTQVELLRQAVQGVLS